MTGRRDVPVTFLLGPARSGTSLLYRVLCLHPAVTYISNYQRRLPALPQTAALNRLPRRAAGLQRAGWFGEGSNAYLYAGRRTVAQRFLPAPVEGEPVFRACGVPQFPDEPALPREQQVDRLRRAFRAMSAADGGRHVLSKRIAHNRRVPVLHAAFPQARFVSLVRDGRAVAASLSKVDWWPDDRVWWYGASPRQWQAEGRDPWEICARNWVEELRALDAGLADVPEEQVLALRYEDFVAAPVPSLRRIAEHMGLDPDDGAWHARLSTISFPDQNNDARRGWRATLSDDALRTVEHWQGERLEALGYLQQPSTP